MSKARKILKRTLVGSSLIGAVALLLWWNSTSAEGWPLFWTCATVVVATVFEVGRMGKLAAFGLQAPLLAAAGACIALAGIGYPLQDQHLNAGDGQWVLITTIEIYRLVFFFAVAGTFAVQAPLRLRGSKWPGDLAVYGLSLAFIGGLTRHRADLLPTINVAIAVGFGLALISLVINHGREALVRAGIAGLLAIWIIPPLLLVWRFWAHWETRGLVALLALSKFGDTCGYYVGSTIGKTHPFPKISPGKTTAGCVGSFVGVTTLSGILWSFHVVPDGKFGLWGALAAGATINVAAQAGDLLKSWTKRRAGVKDSSSIFGPAGGLLDQVDSLLLTVPMACATWPILFPT